MGCAVGMMDLFKVEVSFCIKDQLSAPSPFSMVMDRLMDEIRQECPWTMIYSDDV